MTRRWRVWLVATTVTAALGLGAAVAFAILGSNHENHKAAALAFVLLISWSFIGSGLVGWLRRPENSTGRLLVAVGFSWFSQGLFDSDNRVVFTIASLLDAVSLAVFAHLALAFPTGRLGARPLRALAGSAYVVAFLANATTLLVDAHYGCDTCPGNLLQISDSPGAAHALNVVWDIAGVALLGGVFVVLVRRWRLASPPARRALAAIRYPGGATLFLVALGFALAPVSLGIGRGIQQLGLITFATVPFAFLIGLLRSRLARAGAAQLLFEVRETVTLAEAERGLRTVLGDPALQLGAWNLDRGAYVDVEGRLLEVSPDDPRRVTTMLHAEDGGPLAAIAHDPALLDEPEVMDGVLAAARLALQRDRLQWQLRARLDELERERDFIAKVVNAAPTYFCVIDPEGRIVRFNDTLIAASGTTDDERVRGRPFWDVFPVAEEVDSVREAILAGTADEQQHRWRSASGGEVVVAWSVTPLTDALGRPRLMVTGLDVTHRVAHEDELRRQRDFLRTVGGETPSLLAIVDAEGVVDEAGVNRALTLATGHSDATAVGVSVFDLVIPPAYRPDALLAFRAAVEKNETLKVETPWQSADGSPLLVEWWTASLASWRDGRYLICGVDVTERKQQEVELRRSRSRIVEAQDAERRRLERNLHDGAQQRLVSLSLAIRLAQAKLAGDPHAAEEILSGASAELALALQELRELARGLHPAVLSDRGLAAALGSLAERSLVPVELVIELDERLPGPVEVGVFYVVSEALANVAKYAHASAATVRVRRKDGSVLVEVVDDGIGGADPSRGSGLRGLVDRVDSLDGRLDVSSPPGGGTRVAAEIPLEQVRQAVPQDAG